jgi:putative ABC transport system permease protein
MSDLRYALRQLARSPGFSATVVLTLALGIGACAAIFTVVDAVLLRPLPFAEPERLVMLNERKPPEVPMFVVRPNTFPYWKRLVTSFEGLAVVRDGSYNLTGQGAPVRVYTGKVTANAFPMLRVQPALGRTFAVDEETPGKDAVVILSHGFWQRQLGGRPDVLGQSLQLDGRSHRVVGVMPEGFALPGRFDLYVPHGYQVFRKDESDNRTIEVFARLKPGVTIAQARAELDAIEAGLAREDSDDFEGWQPVVAPMLEARVGEARRPLLALLGAVGLLLLIACANAAHLLLARGTVRAREIAVRAALGASRGRLVGELLGESLVLALAAGALGLLLAQWGVSALLALAPEGLPRLQEIAVDRRVLAFTAALALLTAVVFGLAPALAATRPDLHATLKEGGRGVGPGRHRLRGALVVAEVAIAVVLLAGAGLLVRSFDRLRHVDRGFQPDGALAVSLSLPQEKYASAEQIGGFAGQVLERLGALPGVTAAGVVQDLPFAGGLNFFCLLVEGHPPPDQCDATRYYAISPDYFRAMGIAVRRGRVYEARDWRTATRTTVINEALVRRYFPGQDAVGKRIAASNRPTEWYTVVGVVSDVRDETLGDAIRPQVYAMLAHEPAHALTFVVRGVGAVPPAVRAAVESVDPQQPIASLRPLTDLVAASIARDRFAATLFAVFSAAALLLAAVGIYGVMAYAVARRTGEIGVRLALGARAADVLALVVGQGGRLVALGLVLGVGAALLLAGLVQAMLFEIGPRDPLSYAATALLLALVALLACLVPALHAARIDPMTALRAE